MVTKEIVDYVGQWEEIVDVPVLSRSLDTELGDRVLQVLEQIVEVLKVLPEQIASQLKGWGYDERISERLGEQTVDLPVPQVIESVEMQLECVAEQITDLPVPQILGERVQNRTLEQVMDSPAPQLMEAVVEVTPQERVQERLQNPFPEQIVGCPCASAHGGRP